MTKNASKKGHFSIKMKQNEGFRAAYREFYVKLRKLLSLLFTGMPYKKHCFFLPLW